MLALCKLGPGLAICGNGWNAESVLDLVWLPGLLIFPGQAQVGIDRALTGPWRAVCFMKILGYLCRFLHGPLWLKAGLSFECLIYLTRPWPGSYLLSRSEPGLKILHWFSISIQFLTEPCRNFGLAKALSGGQVCQPTHSKPKPGSALHCGTSPWPGNFYTEIHIQSVVFLP